MSSSPQSSLANQLALAQATYRYCNNNFDDFFEIIKDKIHWLETALSTLAIDKVLIPDRVITMMMVLLSHGVNSIRLQQTPNSDVGSSSSEGRLTEEELIKECVTKEIVYAAADIFMTLIYHDSNYSFYKDCIKTLLSGDRELHLDAKVALLSVKEIRPLVILEHTFSLITEFTSDSDIDSIDQLLQDYFSKEPKIPDEYQADDHYSHMPDVYRFVRGDEQLKDYDTAEALEEELDEDLDEEDSHWRTAMHWAAIKMPVFFNRIEDDIIEERLFTSEDINGLTPIHYVAMNSNDSYVAFLQSTWKAYYEKMMDITYNKFHRAPWSLWHTALYAGNLQVINLIATYFLSDLKNWLNGYNDNTEISAWKIDDSYTRESVHNPRVVLLTVFEAIIKGDKLDTKNKSELFIDYYYYFLDNIDDELKEHLFKLASDYENRDILCFLIECYLDELEDETFLHHCYKLAEIMLKNDSVEELYSIVDTYPDIWDVSYNHQFGGTSLLHRAVENAATLQGVEWLGTILPEACDFSVTDHRGQTPLHIAAAMGNHEAVKMLFFHMPEESGVYDAQDAAGNTALSIAQQRKRFLEKQLASCQADGVELNEEEVREVDKLRAALYESEQVVTLLQSRSNHVVMSVETVHEEFCRAKLLPNIYYQARVPYDDKNPVNWERFVADEMTVNDILQSDKEGRSALYWAFIQGHLELAIMLCHILYKHGQLAQIYELRDGGNLSPMDHASMTVTPRHAKLLLCIEKGEYADSTYLRTFMLMTMNAYIMDDEFYEIVRIFQPFLSYDDVLELLVSAINSKKFNHAYCLWKEISHFSESINLLSISLMVISTHKDPHANLFMQSLMRNHSVLLSKRHQNQYPLTYAVSSNNIEVAIFLIQQVGLQHKKSTKEERESLLSDDAAKEFLIACAEFREKNKTKKNKHYEQVLPGVIAFFPALKRNEEHYYSGAPKVSSSPTSSFHGRSHARSTDHANGFTHNVNTSKKDICAP